MALNKRVKTNSKKFNSINSFWIRCYKYDRPPGSEITKLRILLRVLHHRKQGPYFIFRFIYELKILKFRKGIILLVALISLNVLLVCIGKTGKLKFAEQILPFLFHILEVVWIFGFALGLYS